MGEEVEADFFEWDFLCNFVGTYDVGGAYRSPGIEGRSVNMRSVYWRFVLDT